MSKCTEIKKVVCVEIVNLMILAGEIHLPYSTPGAQWVRCSLLEGAVKDSRTRPCAYLDSQPSTPFRGLLRVGLCQDLLTGKTSGAWNSSFFYSDSILSTFPLLALPCQPPLALGSIKWQEPSVWDFLAPWTVFSVRSFCSAPHSITTPVCTDTFFLCPSLSVVSWGKMLLQGFICLIRLANMLFTSAQPLSSSGI